MSFAQELQSDWANPPAIYRGAPFWSWNAKLEGDRLCRQIEGLKRAGMGGFFMHSRYGLKTPYLSAEWFACVSACVEKARQLGIKAYLYDEDRWPSGAAGGLVTRKNPAYRNHLMEMVPLPGSAVPSVAGAPAAESKEVPGDPFPFTSLIAGREGEAPRERAGLFAVELDERGGLKSYAPIENEPQAGEEQRGLAFDVTTPPPRGWYNDGTYLDTMNAEAVAEFLHVTHQAYADRYGKDFGDLIPAIFTDEPHHGWVYFRKGGNPSVPWTGELPREFSRRRGYDLCDHLPELFHDRAGNEFSKVRHDYFRTITELFVESFTAQIGLWCGKHRIAFTGHVLSEETLHSQVTAVGAAMPHYEHMQWPGIDLLCDQTEELATAKQCASVADQLGKERALSELYGCTGWDWPLEGHKFIGDWQLAVGINFRCPHLTHYSLAGGAKRDYPASIYEHSPWWPYYGEVEHYFGRLCLMLTQGKPLRDVLVIHPVESAWGVYGPDSDEPGTPLSKLNEALRKVIYALSGQHYDWDFGDESLLAKHGKPAGAGLKVGQMTYQVVIVPPVLTLRSTTVALLGKFVAGGGKVLFLGAAPGLVDGKPSDEVNALVGRASPDTLESAAPKAGPSRWAGIAGEDPAAFLPALEALLPRRIRITEDDAEATFVWSMLRQVKGGQLLFLQSHDRKAPHRVTVRVRAQRPVVLWDTRTGDRTRVKAQQDGDRAEFEIDLPPTGSALLSLGVPVTGAVKAHADPVVTEAAEVRGPFDIELSEPNTLPLDYCTYQFGLEPESDPMPTLKADLAIRRRFGLADRLGYQHQPWYLYATGVVDTAPRGHCLMRRRFHVTELPRTCLLAIEQAEDFRILVNGKAAGKPCGHWVDEDIRTIDITSLLQAGDNEVVLDFDYRPDMELEDLYLVGDFGVVRRPDAPAEPGCYTLVAPPTQLKLGSWVGQGLDFYGGAVRYKLSVAKAAPGQRVRVALPEAACTAAAIHVGGGQGHSAGAGAGPGPGSKTFALPWAPFAADVTDALQDGPNDVIIEVIGGRKNILGPLHVPWERWTGPNQFSPENPKWTRQYLLVDHGLMAPVLVQTLEG